MIVLKTHKESSPYTSMDPPTAPLLVAAAAPEALRPTSEPIEPEGGSGGGGPAGGAPATVGPTLQVAVGMKIGQ